MGHNKLVTFIQQCNGIRDRSKVVELWSGVAQYCLLVGNYNSATVILESLESPAIARLQATVCFYLYRPLFFNPFVCCVTTHNLYKYGFPCGISLVCIRRFVEYTFILLCTMHKIIEFSYYYINKQFIFDCDSSICLARHEQNIFEILQLGETVSCVMSVTCV